MTELAALRARLEDEEARRRLLEGLIHDLRRLLPPVWEDVPGWDVARCSGCGAEQRAPRQVYGGSWEHAPDCRRVEADTAYVFLFGG